MRGRWRRVPAAVSSVLPRHGSTPQQRHVDAPVGTSYRSLMYVLASDGLPARLVGPWSKDKLSIVGKYMGIFTSSMNGKWDGLTYVDLFAGPGTCVVEGSGEELRGSPRLALDTRAPFDTVICVEEDAVAREALAERLDRHERSKTAQVLPGDCNVIIGDVIVKMPRRYLSLVFIDPVGVVDLDPATLERLATSRNVDLIILFAQQMSVNRNRWQWRESEDETAMDRLLGRQWRNALTPEVQQFMTVLRGFGFTFVEGARRAFKNKRGAQLYYLVFASKSVTAATFWERISRDEDQPPLFS